MSNHLLKKIEALKQDEEMRNFGLSLFFVFLSAAGECLTPIGNVVAVDGLLKALDTQQIERTLRTNSEIFVGDTLITDSAARGQIKFTDGTSLLLIPDSQYSVDTYHMEENRFFSKLSQGGVQISTGLIAKKVPENFELKTANATIGVRGTVFESRLSQGNLYVGSSSGNLSVTNQGGTLSIGSDNPTQFASVSSANTAPQALAERPAALSLFYFTPPVGAAAATAKVSGLSALAPGIGGLAIIGTVVGVVVWAATQTPSTFSHSH